MKCRTFCVRNKSHKIVQKLWQQDADNLLFGVPLTITTFVAKGNEKAITSVAKKENLESSMLYRDSCRMPDIIWPSHSRPYVTYSQNSCTSPSSSLAKTLDSPAFEAVTKFQAKLLSERTEALSTVREIELINPEFKS